MADPASEPFDRLVLRVIRGNPDDAEVAALVVAMAAVSAAAAATRAELAATGTAPPASVDGWAARWRSVGASVPVGPGAWTAAVGSR